MSVKLLCTGDVHLGRRLSRLPDHFTSAAVGPTAVWQATVDQAIEHGVDAVVLTGDIIDQDNCFFEAYTPLAREIGRLIEAGIGVHAVAGNHDYEVFRRLAREIKSFGLLGSDGQWQEGAVQRDGQIVLQLVGWSFPVDKFKQSPLALGLPSIRSDVPTVGLLHCDVDGATNSVYAPVKRGELAAVGVDAWLLGHIHTPQMISPAGPLIMYPGSPQGLQINEAGPHGPWLIEFERGEAPTARLLPLAALRWEHLDVPLDEVTGDGELDFRSAVFQALKALHERISAEAGALRAVVCRLRLTGRTVIYRGLSALISDSLEDFTHGVTFDGVEYFIDRKVVNETRPDVSLAERSAVADLPGLLAKRLRVLQNCAPVDEYNEIIREARRSIETSEVQRDFKSATYESLMASDEEIAAALLHVGRTSLDAMLAQKESTR